jgi:hypothetical protein
MIGQWYVIRGKTTQTSSSFRGENYSKLASVKHYWSHLKGLYPKV